MQHILHHKMFDNPFLETRITPDEFINLVREAVKHESLRNRILLILQKRRREEPRIKKPESFHQFITSLELVAERFVKEEDRRNFYEIMENSRKNYDLTNTKH